MSRFNLTTKTGKRASSKAGKRAIMLAWLGGASGLLLGGALGAQYIGGLMPCDLCIWQRWPHVAIILFAVGGGIGFRTDMAFLLVALAGFVSVGLGVWHAGIEYQLWEGLATCSGTISGTTGASVADMLKNLQNTDLVRCDEVAWSWLGLSLAGWNALFSLCIGSLAFYKWRQF